MYEIVWLVQIKNAEIEKIPAKVGKVYLSVGNRKFYIEAQKDENGSPYHRQFTKEGKADYRLYVSEMGASLYRSRAEMLSHLKEKDLLPLIRKLPLKELLEIDAIVHDYEQNREAESGAEFPHNLSPEQCVKETRFSQGLYLATSEEDFLETMQELLDDSSLEIDKEYPVLSLYSEGFDVCYEIDKIADRLSNYLGRTIVDVHWSKSNGTIYFLADTNI